MSLFTPIVEGPRQEFRGRAQAAAGRTAVERKVCEVHEFARTGPKADLVSVRRYRTVYHADGRISTEELAVQEAWQTP